MNRNPVGWFEIYVQDKQQRGQLGTGSLCLAIPPTRAYDSNWPRRFCGHNIPKPATVRYQLVDAMYCGEHCPA